MSIGDLVVYTMAAVAVLGIVAGTLDSLAPDLARRIAEAVRRLGK